jgi:predicted membrane channel-forming protein YqfA (hemolysin III family)
MSRYQLTGIILFLVGLVPYTIGGFIYLARHPKSLDSFLKDASQINRFWRAPVFKFTASEWSVFTDHKSRWWCLVGAPVCLTGFVLLVVSSVELGFLALFIALAAVFFGVLSLVGDKRR